MKVIVAVILALGSASAAGSGPYLPSGWRPQGPAFYLPSEVQKPAENPTKEYLLVETEAEASGSEGLREYGPPEVEQSLNIVQTLPDVVTDQAFYVVKNEEVEQLQSEVNAELKSDIVEAITEVLSTVKPARYQEVQPSEQELELVTESSTAAVTEEIEAVTEPVTAVQEEAATGLQEMEATAAAVTEALQNLVQEENVDVTHEEINNIDVRTLENLQSEVTAEQVQQSVEATSELKTQEGSATVQVPEGFLEYGPPGFREYGPPKADQILRSNFESNEVRRRRFSPKFRSSKTLKH